MAEANPENRKPPQPIRPVLTGFWETAPRGPLVAFGIAAMVAVLLGWVLVPTDAGVASVGRFGYWSVLASFLLFIGALSAAVRSEWRTHTLQRTDGWCILGLWGLSLALLMHTEWAFRVTMDEVVLLGTSMSMHLEREAFVPVRGYEIDGAFRLLDGYVDKRPLCFPFLVSVLHDLTGYRPSNGFLLNSGLLGVILTLVYLTGRELSGRCCGLLAAVLLAMVPLVVESAAGSGLDLLNATLMVLTFLAALRVVRRPSAERVGLLLASALLLAQTRYESGLFVVPVALTLLSVWWRERRIILPRLTFLIPLLLLPLPLQQGVFEIFPDHWQPGDKPAAEGVWSPGYLPDNFGHAVSFFFDGGIVRPNAWLLSIVGIPALLFGLLGLRHPERRLNLTRESVLPVLAFGGTVLFLAALLQCYFWGQLDDPVVWRLALPAYVLLALVVGVIVGRCAAIPWVPALAFALAGLGFLSQTIPTLAGGAATQAFDRARIVNWMAAFMAERADEDFLMVTDSRVPWICHRRPAARLEHLREHPEDIAFHLQAGTFDAVYVYQEFSRDIHGRPVPYPQYALPHGVDVETVAEQFFHPVSMGRISRVTAIHVDSERDAWRAFWEETGGASPEPGGLRKAYRDEWARRLP